jgi:hypothetical protein
MHNLNPSGHTQAGSPAPAGIGALQEAVRVEVRRQDLLAETDAYLDGLLAEVGEPSAQDRSG